MSPKVDAFLKRQGRWRAEFVKLREILLASGLDEDLKWGQPCYSLDGKNVALVHGFKEYCAILFHKGALLNDPKGVLIQQTKNVQAARQIRFTSVAEVTKLAKTLKRQAEGRVRRADAGSAKGLHLPLLAAEAVEDPDRPRGESTSRGSSRVSGWTIDRAVDFVASAWLTER